MTDPGGCEFDAGGYPHRVQLGAAAPSVSLDLGIGVQGRIAAVAGVAQGGTSGWVKLIGLGRVAVRRRPGQTPPRSRWRLTGRFPAASDSGKPVHVRQLVPAGVWRSRSPLSAKVEEVGRGVDHLCGKRSSGCGRTVRCCGVPGRMSASSGRFSAFTSTSRLVRCLPGAGPGHAGVGGHGVEVRLVAWAEDLVLQGLGQFLPGRCPTGPRSRCWPAVRRRSRIGDASGRRGGLPGRPGTRGAGARGRWVGERNQGRWVAMSSVGLPWSTSRTAQFREDGTMPSKSAAG